MVFRPLLALAIATLPAAAACSTSDSSALPPPTFRPASGWAIVKPGSSEPNLSAQSVIAVTAGDADVVGPFVPFTGLRRLGPRGILIWTTTMGRGDEGPTADFPLAKWPLRLSAFRLDRGWEMQPHTRIQQRLRWVRVGDWHLDVRVYFGTQNPDRKLLDDTQAELNRLLLPDQAFYRGAEI